jgi:hypothetical protein
MNKFCTKMDARFKWVYPALLGFSGSLFLISALIARSLVADFTVLFTQFAHPIPLPTRFAFYSAPVCYGLSLLSLALCMTFFKIGHHSLKFLQLAKAITWPLFILSLIALPTLLVYLYLPIARAA